MSHSVKMVSVLLTLLPLGLGGCGFRPMYLPAEAPAQATSNTEASVQDNDLAAVRVLGIVDRSGQQLRNDLVSLFSPAGEPSAPKYNLGVNLRETVRGLAESQDGKATIGQMVVTANYTLFDATNGRVLTRSSRDSVVSFRYFGPRYGSVSVERDTRQRALTEVSLGIRNDLAVWFATRQTATPALEVPAPAPEP